MSNTEQMVSVPMGALEKCLRDANLVRFTCDKHVLLLQDLLSRPAAQNHAEVATAICRGCFTEKPKGVPCQTCAEVEAKRSAQHQGEPVAWLVAGNGTRGAYINDPTHWAHGYSVMPLYTHADTGEVERLKGQLAEALKAAPYCEQIEATPENQRETAWFDTLIERDTLRAQLAELPEKLIRAIEKEQERLTAEDYLMDSDDCIKVIRETLSASAEPSAPKCWPCWCCQKSVSMKQRANADGNCPHCVAELDIEYWPFPPRPSATVELDERAEFDAWHQRIWPGESPTLRSWQVWNGRAALERKP